MQHWYLFPPAEMFVSIDIGICLSVQRSDDLFDTKSSDSEDTSQFNSQNLFLSGWNAIQGNMFRNDMLMIRDMKEDIDTLLVVVGSTSLTLGHN